jgi:hypothetical protein
VGNSSTTNAHSPTPRSKVQPSQLARVSVRWKCARNVPKIPTAYTKAVADSSHPMGFPGRFHASSAPTVAKAAMNTTPTTSFSPVTPKLAASFAGNG